MRKRTAVFLAVLCFLLSIQATAYASDTALHIRGPTEVPAAGEEFTVAVELSENPGINVFQTTLLYDRAKLECTEIVPGPVLEGMLNASNPYGESAGGAIIAAATTEPVQGNGVAVEFRFRVLAEGAVVPRTLSETRIGDKNGNPIAFTVVYETENGTELTPGTAGLPFPDVAGHRYEPYIQRAAAAGLFSGFPDGTFRPDESVTRAQFVTVLWRMAGKPAAGQAPFADVAGDAWYADAVAWAWETGAVNGRSETVFDPDGAVTRQEAMKVLFLSAGGVSGMEAMFAGVYDGSFADSAEIADWAKSAMYWSYFNGILGESGDTVLRPKDSATRAELAKALVVFSEKFPSE